MTEGEECLDRAKMAETQRQTQLGHALAAINPLFKRKCDSGFRNGAYSAITEAEFGSHLGNAGCRFCSSENNGLRLLPTWRGWFI